MQQRIFKFFCLDITSSRVWSQYRQALNNFFNSLGFQLQISNKIVSFLTSKNKLCYSKKNRARKQRVSHLIWNWYVYKTWYNNKRVHISPIPSWFPTPVVGSILVLKWNSFGIVFRHYTFYINISISY